MTLTSAEEALQWVHLVVFLVVLLSAAVTDLRQRKIYPAQWGGGLLAGLLFCYMRGGFYGESLWEISLISSLVTACIAFLWFMLIYLLGGLGDGDVKLLVAVATLSGEPRLFLWIVCATACAGGVLAVLELWRRQDLAGGLFRSMKGLVCLRYKREGEDAVFIPYGLAVCIGGFAALCLQ